MGNYADAQASKSSNLQSMKVINTGSPSTTAPVPALFPELGPVIITSTQNGEILVFKDDSTKLWSFKVQSGVSETESMFLDEMSANGINNSPVVEDIDSDGYPEILFGTELGELYALNTKGKTLWKFRADAAIRGRIALANASEGKKYVVAGSTDGNVYILSNKGKLLKKIDISEPIEATPVVLNGNIIIGTAKGNIIALNIKGEILWTQQTGGKITAEPLPFRTKDRTVIFLGSTDNFLYCITSSGEMLWKYETGGSIYSKVLVEDIDDDGEKELIVGSCDNNIHVLNLNGIRKWSYETEFWVVGSPLLMDINLDSKKEIVAGSYDTKMYVLASEGRYVIGYIPGISGIVPQEGSYSDIPTHAPGTFIGKKLHELKMPGMVAGMCESRGKAVIQTKTGHVVWVGCTN